MTLNWQKSASRLLLIVILGWSTLGFGQTGKLYPVKSQPLAALQVSATTTPSTCGYAGSVTFSATGGTPPYKYAFGNRRFQSSAYLIAVGPSVDTAWVQDATGVLAYTIVAVNNTYPYIYVDLADLEVPSGCTAADGQLTAKVVNGGSPPFLYSLDKTNWQSSPTFSNLTAGYYFIWVKDANGCVSSVGAGLGATGCTVFEQGSSENSCNSNGYLTLTPDPGMPLPVKYSLDGVNYQSSPTFNNLPAGEYQVHAIDGSGQNHLWTTYLYPVCTLTTKALATSATCGSQNGSITAEASNGFPPYQYSLDGINYQLGNTFTGLPVGDYTLLVKDGSGTIATADFSITSGCPYITATASPAMCGNSNGTITCFSGSTGTPPFQYSIDGVNFQTAPVFSNLPIGNYTVTIKDANNYLGSTTVDVTNTCLTITATPTVSFCSQADGSLTITASGGVSPYSYSLNGVNFQLSGIFASLTANTYTVTVKDAAGNIGTSTATIGDNPGPSLSIQPFSATCAGNDGSLLLTGTGGTPPYQFSLDNTNWQQTGNFSDLAPGNYLPYIKDVFGCTTPLPATITLTDNLTVNSGNPVTICQGSSTILNAVSNGASFTWSPATGLNNPALLQPTANPATTTTYTLSVNLGACQKQSNPVIVTVNPAPTPNAGNDTTTCYEQSLQLTGSGGISYNWSPASGLNNPNIPNPIVEKPDQTVTYQLSVSDANGCASLQSSNVIVHVTPPAQLFAGNDTSVLAGQPIQLHAIDINNSGFTSYSWAPATGLNNPDIPDPSATLNASTTYTVTATTAAGCESTADLTVKVYYTIGIFVPSAFTPNGDGHNDILRVILLGMRELQYFAVFNRWGQRFFYTTNVGQGWDGMLNGRPAAAETYVWMSAGIDLNGRLVQQKGTVLLIR